MFPPFIGVGDIALPLQQKAVEKHVGKAVELPPGTPEVVRPGPPGKQSAVEAHAHGDPFREEKKVTGGDKTRQDLEYPRAEDSWKKRHEAVI